MSKKNKHRKVVNTPKTEKLKKSWVILTIVLVATTVLWLLTFNPQPHMGGDNAQYISLAHSISSRFEYLNLAYIGQAPETSVPWGFPFLLAIVMWIFGFGSFIPLKSLCFILGLVAVWVSIHLLRIEINEKVLVILFPIALFGLNFHINEFSHWILSEMPSLFTVVSTVYILDYLVKSKQEKSEFLFPLAAFCIVYFGFLIRPAGAPFVIAAFIIILKFGCVKLTQMTQIFYRE